MAVCPKTQNRYCFGCKKHQLLTLSVVKSRPGNALIKINRRKRLKYLTKGPGGKFTKNPSRSDKTCKKPNLLLTCPVCKRKRNWAYRRAVKFTIKN